MGDHTSQHATSPADEPGPEETAPSPGRRLLARIPGLSQLTGQGTEASGADPGWVFHEADEQGAFEGWLYHYADGTMVDADGVEYAVAAPEPDPGSDAAPEREPHLSVVESPADPVPPPQLTVVEAPPEADPEPEMEPEAAPEAAAPESQEPSEQDPAPAADQERPSDVPDFVEYSPTHLRGYLLGAVFVIAAVAAVLTLFVAVSENSVAALVVAGACMVLALVAWWALLSWKPTVVTIREGVLEIGRAGSTETFELTDPSTVVAFTGRPGSPAWTATVKTPNGPRTVLRPSEVKPRQFERIVRHYRSRTANPTDRTGTSGTSD